MNRLRDTALVALFLLSLAALFHFLTGCNVTPKQAGAGTDAACKLVEALTQDATVESVCAFAPELAAIGASVMATRADSGADAGPRAAMACKVIPTTQVCATNAETLAAIRKVKAAR